MTEVGEAVVGQRIAIDWSTRSGFTEVPLDLNTLEEVREKCTKR